MTAEIAIAAGMRAGVILRHDGDEQTLRDCCASVWPWRSDPQLRQSYQLGFSIGWVLATTEPLENRL